MRTLTIILDNQNKSENIVFQAKEKHFIISSDEASLGLNFVYRDDLIKGGTHEENFNKSKENIPRKIKHKYLKITTQKADTEVIFKLVLLP